MEIIMKTKNRTLRTFGWSKDKKARFHNRYCRWLLHKLKKEGCGHTDFEGYDARRRLQLGLERMNRGNN